MISPRPRVDVLLATFNGAKYLPELLRSLAAQEYTEWRLVVGDDGSSDGTAGILARAAAADPERVLILPPSAERLGPSGNFSRLCAASDAAYAMLCDQDDVWLPDKIGLTVARMLEVEAREGTDLPILVHTDLRVVADDLSPLSDSLWRYQHLDPRLVEPRNILVQSHVTGCTVMANRALLQLACPIPAAAMMHDWWLALAASVYGRISAIDRATILYRQHGANSIGVRRWGPRLIIRRAMRPRDARQVLHGVQEQSRAFLERFGARLPEPERELFAGVAELSRRGWLSRRWLLARHGVWKGGIARNLGMLVYV